MDRRAADQSPFRSAPWFDRVNELAGGYGQHKSKRYAQDGCAREHLDRIQAPGTPFADDIAFGGIEQRCAEREDDPDGQPGFWQVWAASS
ncbi:MAG: hypothetical protein AAFN44_20115 [Pseudomonadota bacterium]